MRVRRRLRYYYGWNIVGASFLAHIAGAEGNSSLLGLFFNPLHREFGWSRTVVAGVQTLNRLLEGLVSPLIGPVLDRRGPRALMIAGGVIATLSFIMLTRINAPWQFYVLRGAALAVAFALMGGFVINVCVSNWFVRHRGRAIGLANMGSRGGNLALVPLVVWIISTRGWRSSFLLFAVLPLVFVVIPSALVMRRRPEDMGLLPDGDSNAEPRKPAQGVGDISTRRAADVLLQEPVWTRLAAVQTVPFWLMVLSFSMASFADQGINFSIAPYVEDLGFGPGMVATILMLRAGGQFSALPVWGLISEKAEKPIIRVLPLSLQAAACVFFLMASSQPGFLWLAVIVFGTSMPGIGVIQEVLWATYFGRQSLGTVRSTANPFYVVLGSAGPLLMNKIFDMFGSYRIAFLLFIGLFLFSSVLMWVCRPPGAPQRPQG